MTALWQQHTYSGMTADSRQVKPANLFVAYPGEYRDGRDYILQAIEQGATGVIYEAEAFDWQQLGESASAIPHQAIAQLRHQVSQIAAEFYEYPSRQLWVIGVTGTNGKTSCSHWLAQCFAELKRPTAVIGTLGHGVLGQQDSALNATANTTPDAICLQAWMADYVAQGAEVLSMEVSSHGLHQGRVNGVEFDVAIFTNLTRDHLDYHGTMEAYGQAKRQLFDCPSLRCSIINIDDDFGRQIAQDLREKGKPVLTYGIANAASNTHGEVADVRVIETVMSAQGMYLKLITPQGETELRAQVVGEFNIYNLLAVFSSLLISGVDLHTASAVMSRLQAVPGRMQQFGGAEKPLLVVDYAHTPDALQKALQTLRVSCHGKLICVFGCGGNRDVGKRPEMGRVANEFADTVVVTSDNPRDEDALDIIGQISTHISADKLHISPDRAEAIQLAVQQAKSGDVVLVAGKGHEAYQEIAGVRYPFSDAETVQQILSRWSA